MENKELTIEKDFRKRLIDLINEKNAVIERSDGYRYKFLARFLKEVRSLVKKGKTVEAAYCAQALQGTVDGWKKDIIKDDYGDYAILMDDVHNISSGAIMLLSQEQFRKSRTGCQNTLKNLNFKVHAKVPHVPAPVSKEMH